MKIDQKSLLEGSWAAGRRLGPSWVHLRRLGAIVGRLGALVGRLGGVLGRLGCVFGCLEACSAFPKGVSEPPWPSKPTQATRSDA